MNTLNKQKWLLRIKSFGLTLLWLVFTFIIALIPFLCQLAYKFYIKKNENTSSASNDLFSLDNIYKILIEEQHIVYMVIAITTALYLDNFMDKSLNYMLNLKTKRTITSIPNIISGICLGVSLPIAIFGIGNDKSQTIYTIDQSLIILELVIFAVCLICVFISKFNLFKKNLI